MNLKKLIVISIALMSVIGFSMAVLGNSTAGTHNLSSINNSGTAAPQLTGSSGYNASAISQFHTFKNHVNSSASSNITGLNTSAGNNTFPSFIKNASSNLKKNLFVPNLKAGSDYRMMNGTVSPLYLSAPAPMGIGDFGIKNVSGNLTPYQLQTSSFEGTISISNLTALYALNDDPGNVTVQLNTVLNNITLFGNSTYSFWTQNVFLYSSQHHTIAFEDNIWNFSSPQTYLSSNAIYNSTGNVYPYSGVHIALGPTFAVKTPFTIHMYINSTLINNRNAVFFNYSIPQLSVHGTYDRVIFNSTYNTNSSFKTPKGYFLISGKKLTPTGYLLYDAEMMIGGPGGGSTTNLYNVNASMTLKYFNGTTKSYLNVPSAYNYGTDTGETSCGESIYWTSSDVAEINTGPSILGGMWGIQSSLYSGHMKISGQLEPSNAFMFVNTGTMINNFTAQWAPTMQNGNFMLYLTPGSYSIQFLLSNYAPAFAKNVSATSGKSVNIGSIKLVFNESYGGYTPLYAFNNNQLSSISTTGNGTPENPFTLDNQQFIDPVFGHVNGFGFPSFMGVFLSRTTEYVSTFGGYQPVTVLTYNEVAFGVDTLPYAFYKVQNYSMLGLQISGLFIPGYFGFIAGEVNFWSSSNDFVSFTTFNALFPFAAVNSTDITISNSNNEYYNAVTYLYCGNVILASDQIGNNMIYEVNGTLNIVDSNLINIQLIVLYGAHANLRGNTIKYDFVVIYKSILNSTGNHVKNDLMLIIYSYFNSGNDRVSQSFLGSMSSVFTMSGGSLHRTFAFSFNSSVLLTGTALSSVKLYSINSTTDLNSITFFGIEIMSAGGTASIQNGVGSLMIGEFTNDSVDIVNSQICAMVAVDETGNFTMAGSMVTGMEYVSLLSNNTFKQSNIQNLPSNNTFYSQLPTFILAIYGKNTFENVVFAVNKYQSSAVINNMFDIFNINSITFIEGVNTVTESTFYSNGGNNGANLILEYGVNNVQSNTFESKNVSLIGNPFGSGSSLIVYGGQNVIGNNRFITLNSPAQSSLIKYGDAATQNSNQYLYSVNFTEAGLPAGTNWTLNINGASYSSNLSYISVLLSPGTYTYKATSSGYSNDTGSVTVVSSSISEHLTFSKPSKYKATFTESGLPARTTWYVSLSNGMSSGAINGTSYSFSLVNGTYSFTVTAKNTNYSASPSSGAIKVNGSAVSKAVKFSYIRFSVTFTESGLPGGMNWSVTMDQKTITTFGSSITFTNVLEGSYTYTVADSSVKYTPVASSGTVDVTSNTSQTLNFKGVGYTVTFSETGLSAGTNWTVTVNGHAYSSNGKSSISMTVPAGSIVSYSVGNESGYISSMRSGSFTVSGNYNLTVNFARPGISPAATYAGIAITAIAGLAVGAGVMFVLRKTIKA